VTAATGASRGAAAWAVRAASSLASSQAGARAAQQQSSGPCRPAALSRAASRTASSSPCSTSARPPGSLARSPCPCRLRARRRSRPSCAAWDGPDRACATAGSAVLAQTVFRRAGAAVARELAMDRARSPTVASDLSVCHRHGQS
jgi:hypothetical protein